MPQGGFAPQGGFLAEPPHMDGAGSILHIGLTLFGRRVLDFQQGGNLPNVRLEQGPGSVYMGVVTGPYHQALHQEASRHEMLHVSAGSLGVKVLLRTPLFPNARARLANTTPSPQNMFYELASTFVRFLQSESFCLPSLSERLAEA